MMLLLASCPIVAIDETKATVVESRNLVERQDIVFYLEELDNVLRSMDVVGEVCLYGGAVMQRRQIKPATQNFVEDLFET